LRGGRIGGRGRGGEKGVGKGLRGEDFPGKFGKPPDHQIRQGPPSPKTKRPPPVRGRSPTPSLPLAYAHMYKLGFFLNLLI